MPRVATREPATHVFGDADAYKTWRVVAPVPTYTDTTEGFGFSNGQAVIAGLPKAVKSCGRECGGDGEMCRVHERVFHLNNLRNYPTFARVKDERTARTRTEQREGYRILTEEEYEREFGDVEPDEINLGDF